jgi:hypothetical protein
MTINLDISNIFSKSFDDVIIELNIYLKNNNIDENNYKIIVQKGYEILLQIKDMDIEDIRYMLIMLFLECAIFQNKDGNYIPLQQSIEEVNYLGFDDSDNDSDNDSNNDSNNSSDNNSDNDFKKEEKIIDKEELEKRSKKEIFLNELKKHELVNNPFDISSNKRIWNEAYSLIYELINIKVN